MSREKRAKVEKTGTHSAWAEQRVIYSSDVLLRKHGFKIEARPKGKPALWRMGEKVYTQAEAVTLCELAEG